MSLASPSGGTTRVSSRLSSRGTSRPTAQPATIRPRPSRAPRATGSPRPLATSSCVTMWTSRSGPESRATVAPTPGPKTYCQVLRRLEPSTICVALTPRANSSREAGTSSPMTWWNVPPRSSTSVRWTASSFGEADVSPSLRAMYTARISLPEPLAAMRAARRMSVRPSGPPVRPTTMRSRACQIVETSCSVRYCRRYSSTRSAVHSRASSRRAVRLPGRK